MTGYGLPNCLRITTGTREQDERCLEALGAALRDRGVNAGVRSFVATPAPPRVGCVAGAGDKSISHRSLMLAGIAAGRSRISGFLDSEDCLATLGAMRAMAYASSGPEATTSSSMGRAPRDCRRRCRTSTWAMPATLPSG